MPWWIWIAFGLVLAAIELATPGGFFIVFFGIGAIAVGVLELVEHRDALVTMGCRYGQGYLFSEPMTPEEFLSAPRGTS